jgi:hypothetical protein
VPFNGGSAAGSFNSFVASDAAASMTGWQFKIADVKTPIDKMYVAVRYVLT